MPNNAEPVPYLLLSPQSNHQKLRTATDAPKVLKLLQLPNCKPVSLASSILSHINHKKDFAHCFHLSVCCFLLWPPVMGYVPNSWELWVIIFSMAMSTDMLASQYLRFSFNVLYCKLLAYGVPWRVVHVTWEEYMLFCCWMVWSVVVC